MSIKITKQLIVKDDIAFGLGQVTQKRNVSGTGIEDVTYDEVNASQMPTTNGTVQSDLDGRYTKAESDGKYPPTSNVLTKTNSIVYTPSNDYHPSTKKYVDDTLVAIGAGDMARSIYDSLSDGVVNDSRSLGGVVAADHQAKRGTVTAIDDLFALGYYSGTDIVTSPISGEVLIEVASEGLLTIQKLYSAAISGYYYRLYSLGAWLNWDRMLPDSEVTPGILPVGAITMFSGDLASIPASWALCDGSNGTPNLVNKFIMGGGTQGDIGAEGGTDVSSMPEHTHTANHNHTATADNQGTHHHSTHSHSHTMNHNHPAGTTSTDSHNHTVSTLGTLVSWGGGNDNSQQGGKTATTSNDSHNHTFDVANYSGSTGASAPSTYDSGSHGHNITVGTNTMNTGSAGNNGDNRPPYFTLAYIQRVA